MESKAAAKNQQASRPVHYLFAIFLHTILASFILRISLRQGLGIIVKNLFYGTLLILGLNASADTSSIIRAERPPIDGNEKVSLRLKLNDDPILKLKDKSGIVLPWIEVVDFYSTKSSELQKGDYIFSVEGERTPSIGILHQVMQKHKKKKKISLEVYRSGKMSTITSFPIQGLNPEKRKAGWYKDGKELPWKEIDSMCRLDRMKKESLQTLKNFCQKFYQERPKGP